MSFSCISVMDLQQQDVHMPVVIQAGARKVYAVEASGMAKFAQQLVAASGICLPPPSGITCCTCLLLQSYLRHISHA